MTLLALTTQNDALTFFILRHMICIWLNTNVRCMMKHTFQINFSFGCNMRGTAAARNTALTQSTNIMLSCALAFS